MGFLKDNEAEQFSYIPIEKRGEILCRYLKYKESLRSIGEDMFGTEGGQASQKPSQVTRAFGFSGRGIAGTYANVPEQAFYDFAGEMFPDNTYDGFEAGTFDRWLKGWYQRRNRGAQEVEFESPFEDAPMPGPRLTPRPNRAPRQGDPNSGGGTAYRRQVYANNTPDLGPLAPILLLVAVCVLLWGAGKVIDFGRGAIFSGKQMLGEVNNFLAEAYNAEVFEFEGKEFVGNRRFDKPSGACMRIDHGTDYTIGYFDGDVLDGYGMIVQAEGDYLQLGTFRKNKLDGWAILRANGVDYVAEFKKGEADGYGYCYDHGREQIVKFEDASAQNLNFGPEKIVAERTGENWIKPNGKTLKMKDNTYKDIEWLREGLIAIEGVEYYFDAEVAEAYYDGPETRLSWDMEGCEYDSILTDLEGTWLYYTTGEGLEGRHQYYEKKNLICNTFEVEISVD